MKLIYEFDLIVESLPDDAVEKLAEHIIERTDDGPDVTPVGDEQGGVLQFYREADSAAAAIMTAIEDARVVGLSVAGVDSGARGRTSGSVLQRCANGQAHPRGCA